MKYNNIKGDTPPDPVPPTPPAPAPVPVPVPVTAPYPISGYKYSLDLTTPLTSFLNRYEIKVTFYSNRILFIDMNVYNRKRELIAKNSFRNNTWKIAEDKDGYDISYDPDLLKEIGKIPSYIKCILDPHIKYVKGTPNKIIASGSVSLNGFILFDKKEEIDECSNTDCS